MSDGSDLAQFLNFPVLAPLTRGGHLPFRRLCADFGAGITVSEMVFARRLLKGERRERALLRHHPSERCFGVQLASRDPIEAQEAGQLAIESGAQFVDLNCGCPTDDVARYGLGAALLRKPKKIALIVGAMCEKLSVPVTVKIRLGWDGDRDTPFPLVQQLVDCGAQAVTVHGRTRTQRYTKAADWNAIAAIQQSVPIPIIGNGDILTWYEAKDRISISNVAAVMVGRGALIKPWLFSEIAESRDHLLTTRERIEVYLRLTHYMKEHFGGDELGCSRIMTFLPWHFSFFTRYRPLPFESYANQAKEHPLLQTRFSVERCNPLDDLLCSPAVEDHTEISLILLRATELAEAISLLTDYAVRTADTRLASPPSVADPDARG